MWELPPPDPGIEIVLASRGMSKGVAQTVGAQVVVKPVLQLGPIQVGGQWKNVDSPSSDGEAAAFVNFTPKVGAFQLTLGAAFKFQTGVQGDRTDEESFEFTSSVSRKFGIVALSASAVYSTDDFGATRRSMYLESGPSFDLDKNTRLSAAIGRRSRTGSPDYTSFNGGISKTFFHKITLDARYHDTTQGALAEAYGGRFVVSVRLGL
jgi:uncharacterized protein (TIGR02001 family)